MRKRIISGLVLAATVSLGMGVPSADASGACVSGATPDGGSGALAYQATAMPSSQAEGIACWFQVPSGRGATLEYEATSVNHWRVYTTGTVHPIAATAGEEVTLASSGAGSEPAGRLEVSLAPGDYVVVSLGADRNQNGDGVCAGPSCVFAGTLGAHV